MQIVLTGTSANVIQVCQVLPTADSAIFQGKTATLRFTCTKGSTWNPANLGVILYYGTNGRRRFGWHWRCRLDGRREPELRAERSLADLFSLRRDSDDCDAARRSLQATPTGAAVDGNSYLWLTNVTLTESVSRAF
jgi:hypothetical protein